MKELKKSNEPIFWLLFGAGGMWSAIFAPVIILTMLLLPAFGVVAGENIWHLTATSLFGRVFILAMIVLPLWCGLHRVHHCLHDMKIHSPFLKLLCYGVALILSIIAFWVVISG